MPVPKPPASLDNSCFVVHEKTLYAYSPDAFLSLPLEKESEWEELELEMKVTGAACVGSTPPDASQAGFYLVGGKADGNDPAGLVKYTYATRSWSSIPLATQDMMNREGHAATYIQADDVILTYAGNQDGSRNPSSQTFTIKTSEPFTVKGYESKAPPAVSPYLFRWSDADVGMITGGGGPQDGKVWLFNPTAGWRDSGASLKAPPKDRELTWLIPIDGDDGSKLLYRIDASQSPVAVSLTVMQNAKGEPVHDSAAIAGRSVGSDSAAETIQNWPKYNSTFAPKSMKRNVPMAQAPDGTAFMLGPDEDLFAFDAKENRWADASAMLGPREQLRLLATSTSSPTPASSSTAPPSTTRTATSTTTTASSSTTVAAAEGGKDQSSGPGPNGILGITLGCILGFMALLGLILLLLRRRKKRRNHPEADGGAEEKDTTAFAKSTLPSKSAGHFRGHYPQASHESYSSMAILMGRVGKDKGGLTRKLSNGTNRSSVSSMHKKFKSTISKPIPQMASHPVAGQDDRSVAFAPTVAEPRPRNRNVAPEAQDSTRRSSGWNRYWSGGSALQILGLGPAKRNTGVSEQSSHYSEAGNQPISRQDSATVPPLNLEGRPEVNNVISGSPMVSQFASQVPAEGIAGKIVRPTSPASSGYSSGIPESINDGWDANHGGKAWGTDRAPGSAYAPDYYFGASSNSNSAALRPPPSGVSKQPQLAMASTSSDMSWLNLGDQSRRV
ncbi:hypothetical protein CDD83_8545 [Cordyceps sp. RAO-2017]|nr:hypothetical protein CDD83_8545 [Cordyceps sp. RAO-2017]